MTALVQGFATSADGTRIAYETHGSGPTVVIVNRAFETRASERELATLLSDRFNVACYDRRGRGDSGDTAPYAPTREIEDLAAVIDEVGAPAFVYGDMFGGALALDAVAAGLPIERLAVNEPPFVVDDSRPPYPAGFLERLRALARADRRQDLLDEYWRHCFLTNETVIENTRDLPFAHRFRLAAPTLVYDYELLGERITGAPLPAAWAAAIQVPVLIVEHEDRVPYLRNTAAALEALLPNARKRTFGGGDGLVSPSRMARAFAMFFTTKNPAPRRFAELDAGPQRRR